MVMSMLMVMVVVVIVLMMMVVMIMVVVRDFLLAVHADGEMGRGDAAAGDRLTDEFDARNVKGVQFRDDGVGIGEEFKQRGGKHVAGGAH